MSSTVSEPPERTIKATRCKHCGRQTYLQYLPIPNTETKWVLFDRHDGKLHHCMIKPLDSWKKRLIQDALNSMSLNNNDESRKREVVRRIDMVIEDLNYIRQSILTAS